MQGVLGSNRISMHDSCESKAHEITALRKDYGHVLKVVFAINLVMFFTEFGGGLLACSTALLADSLDMFGDATVYAISLYVLHKGNDGKQEQPY